MRRRGARGALGRPRRDCYVREEEKYGDEEKESKSDDDFDAVIEARPGRLLGEGHSREGPSLDDYDTLRKGIVDVGKFQSALSVSGMQLSTSDIEALTDAYRSASDPMRVAYTPFVHAIDGGDERLEARPGGLPLARTSRRYSKRHPGSVDMNELNSILNPMRQILRSRPLILKNFFKKKDTNNMRAVTITQFMSVLKSVGLLGDNVDDTVRVLRAAYPAKHPEKICYTSFCRDVDN